MVVTVILAVLMGLCILEVVINNLNPTPKMQNVPEEKKFQRTICKTRKMFECTLR